MDGACPQFHFNQGGMRHPVVQPTSMEWRGASLTAAVSREAACPNVFGNIGWVDILGVLQWRLAPGMPNCMWNSSNWEPWVSRIARVAPISLNPNDLEKWVSPNGLRTNGPAPNRTDVHGVKKWVSQSGIRRESGCPDAGFSRAGRGTEEPHALAIIVPNGRPACHGARRSAEGLSIS